MLPDTPTPANRISNFLSKTNSKFNVTEKAEASDLVRPMAVMKVDDTIPRELIEAMKVRRGLVHDLLDPVINYKGENQKDT